MKFYLFNKRTNEIEEVEAEGSGSQFMAVCPEHEDHNPSLSINPEKGMFNCFGCGFSGQLCDPPDDPEPDPLARPIEIYDYRSAGGDLLYQVLRYAPKTFRQRRPDGKGRWIWNLEGVIRVPYRFQELLSTPGLVFICEGEKDTDNLRALGLTVTTSGAATSWTEELNQCFRGRDVIILPHNDMAGTNYAKTISRNLKGVAKSVKVAELPDRPANGGDVSDFLNLPQLAGITKEHFLSLIDVLAEEWIEEPPAILDTTFPRGTVRGFLKKFADTYSKYFESPYEFWIFNAMVYLGSLVVGKVRLDCSLETEPRLYVACIGKTGVTRKSEARKQSDKLFREYLKIQEKKLPVLKGVGSANGLAKFLQEHPNGILQYDELRALFQKAGISGSVLLETVASLFDENHYSNYTKDEAITIENASLSVIGATTLALWEEIFDSAAIGTGLINRFWIVPGQTDKVIPIPKIPTHEKLTVTSRLVKALESYPQDQVTTLSMEPEAQERYDKWYREYKANDAGDITARLDNYFLRLMMLLCVSEGKTSIDLDLVERVIRLMEWQKNVRTLHQPKEFDNQVAKLEDGIRRAGLEKIRWGRTELYKKVHGERGGVERFKRALRSLEAEKVLRCEGREVVFL